MRALVAKELMPLLLPALAGTLLCLTAWLVLFEAHAMFFAAPSEAQPMVLLLACAFGASLGYHQIAVERGRATLSYLLHRDAAPSRVLLAKCVAAWTLLALILWGSLVAAAAIRGATSPFAPAMQERRLLELLFAATIAVPAHALGLYAAGLRGGLFARLSVLVIAVAGLVGWLAAGAAAPLEAAPAAGLLAFLSAAATAPLLLAVRARLALADDPERVPRPAEIAGALVVFPLLLGLPASFGLALLQLRVVRGAAEGRAPIVWHPKLGPAVAEPTERTEGVRYRLRDAAGAIVAELHLRPGGGIYERTLGGERVVVTGWDREELEWVPVWEPDGRLLGGRTVWSLDSQGLPNFSPPWKRVRYYADFDGDSVRDGAPLPVVLEVVHDPPGGQFHVLAGRTENGADVGIQPRHRVVEVELRSLVRGDGRPFGRDAFPVQPDRDDLAWPSWPAYGQSIGGWEAPPIAVFDPRDETAWTLDASWPVGGFVAVQRRLRQPSFDRKYLAVGRLCVTNRPGIRPEGEDLEAELAPHVRVRAFVTGDLLASTARVVDARTGEVLLEARYGLDRPEERLAAAGLYASELFRPPALLLAKYIAGESAFSKTIGPDGFLVAPGRRAPLLLADLAVALALALVARARIARRGAEAWRQRTWLAAITVLGPIAALAFLAVEPLVPRGADARAPASQRGPRRPAPLRSAPSSEPALP